MAKRCAMYSSPREQKIQPIGLVGRREAISAPTAGYASDSNPVSTAKPGSYLNPPTSRGSSSVMKSSMRASVMSTTHTAHADHATQAAVRRLIPRPLTSVVPLSLTSQYYSTAPPSPERYGIRYEPASY